MLTSVPDWRHHPRFQAHHADKQAIPLVMPTPQAKRNIGDHPVTYAEVVSSSRPRRPEDGTDPPATAAPSPAPPQRQKAFGRRHATGRCANNPSGYCRKRQSTGGHKTALDPCRYAEFGVNKTIYTIVRNVVKPAMASVRTVVPVLAQLKCALRADH